MTAEIVIMNKEAVALAADSAVTVGGGETSEKIFTSANKLFALSKYKPVGIMVYGSANLMNVPWETIIKIYREDSLDKKAFGTLEEYANHFIGFLDNGNYLFPESVQENYLTGSVASYYDFVRNQITEKIHSVIDTEGKISYEEIERTISKIIREQYELYEKTKNVPSIPKSHNKNILEKYGKVISEVIERIFEKLPISKSDLTRLKKIAASLFSKFPDGIESEGISGVVIAGFGKKDVFPSLKSFDMEGIVGNKLKFKEHHSTKISFEMSASVIAFAQTEMVNNFMEGVDPLYRSTEESYLSQIFGVYAEMVIDKIKKYTDEDKKDLREELTALGDEILKEHAGRLAEYGRERYTTPILDVVSILPKDELAAMAESLVNLTSFKRKVTMESETVGGPIDVAVISKGDGLIWIKRKHYFKAELNPQFFANYYGGGIK